MDGRKKIYLSSAIKARIQPLSADEKGFLLDAMLLFNETGEADELLLFPGIGKSLEFDYVACQRIKL